MSIHFTPFSSTYEEGYKAWTKNKYNFDIPINQYFSEVYSPCIT